MLRSISLGWAIDHLDWPAETFIDCFLLWSPRRSLLSYCGRFLYRHVFLLSSSSFPSTGPPPDHPLYWIPYRGEQLNYSGGPMATAFCARGLNQGPPQLPLLGHGRLHLLLLLQVARQRTTTPQRVAQRLISPLQIDSYEHRKAIDSISYSPPHQAVQVEEEGWVTPLPFHRPLTQRETKEAELMLERWLCLWLS